ncbi:nucleolar protein 12 [Daktulosphaira vitifoliae]|uniref:nucleolar protein 12 n=1 Tax=Daktulosphaira vitifoliae TaxID=58002 RepID=UPI0021AAC6CC|nr:nucleolar protein 12 [Daktulosphaira vitifoliae]
MIDFVGKDDFNDRTKIKRHRKPINRRTKRNITFDEKARCEFLTGFHKRKLARKKKAKEDFERRLKEEKKRIKAEAREAFKKLTNAHPIIPEPLDYVTEEYNLENHTVQICELSTDEIAKTNNWIGSNQVVYEEEKKSEKEDSEEEDNNGVPGMNFGSIKEIKKAIKKQAAETVQNSKIFKMKNKIERIKDRKKAKRKRLLESKRQKWLKKKGKKK